MPRIVFLLRWKLFFSAWLLLSTGKTAPAVAQPSGRLGPNFIISQAVASGSRSVDDAALAYNKHDHTFLVVWTQYDTAGHNQKTDEIFGQRMAGEGFLLGAPFQISHTVIQGDEIGAQRPAVVYNGATHEYLVVFESDRLGREMYGIFGQRLRADGAHIGDEFQIAAPVGRPAHPVVVWNSAEQAYLVVWQADADLAATSLEVFGQRIDADPDSFSLTGPALQISQMADPVRNRHAQHPAIAYNSQANEYMVVWHSNGDPLPAATTEIFGQRLTAEGTATGPDDFQVSSLSTTTSFGSSFDPALTYNQDEEAYLVVWSGLGAGLAAQSIETFGAILDHEGVIRKADFQISHRSSSTPPGNTLHPAVAYGAQDQAYLVVWHTDYGFDQFVVEGRPLEASGVGLSEDLTLSATLHSFLPALAYNATDNEFLVVWKDQEVMGQRFTTEVFATSVAQADDPAESALLHANYPNPFRTTTTLPFTLTRASAVQVRIFNMLGQDVATLVSAYLPPGQHVVTWEATGMPGGVYLARLETDGQVLQRLITRYR